MRFRPQPLLDGGVFQQNAYQHRPKQEREAIAILFTWTVEKGFASQRQRQRSAGKLERAVRSGTVLDERYPKLVFPHFGIAHHGSILPPRFPAGT